MNETCPSAAIAFPTFVYAYLVFSSDNIPLQRLLRLNGGRGGAFPVDPQVRDSLSLCLAATPPRSASSLSICSNADGQN